MCEFCITHGEGKKWYEVMENYSKELLGNSSWQASRISYKGPVPQLIIASLRDALTSEEEEKIKELEEQVARVKDPGLSPAAPAEDLPLGIPAAYWLDLRHYDPAQKAKELLMVFFIPPMIS